MFYSLRYLTIVAAFFLILALNSSRCEAGVAILVNDTNAPVHFSIFNADGKQQQYTLDRADVIPIPIVDKIGVAFESEGKPRRYLLQANAIFQFVMTDKTLDLRTFLVPAPPDEDPNLPPPKARDIAHATYTIAVKILVDDDQPVVQKIWEKELRERVEAASEIFERHCGVRFEVKAVDTWVSDNAITDFEKTIQEFESKVNPAPRSWP